MENVAILRKLEHLEKKIANFKNHRRFTLRCLSQRITPNSLKLRSNIKTTRGKRILEKAERQLANERIRNINNMIEACSWETTPSLVLETTMSTEDPPTTTPTTATTTTDMETSKEYIYRWLGIFRAYL